MKKIKELKTKNGKVEYISLSKSCTCSVCGNKIPAGNRFLRIKSNLFGTRNYCSALCMQHPISKTINLSEEYTRFTNLMEQFDMTELPDGLQLSTTDNYEEFLKCYCYSPNIGISDYDYSPENLRKLIPMEDK